MKTYEEISNEIQNRVEKKQAKQKVMRKYSLMGITAAFALAIGIGGGMLWQRAFAPAAETPNSTPHAAVIEKHFSTSPLTLEGCWEIGTEIDWNNTIDPCRYLEVEFDGRTYSTKLIAVHADHEGALLGTGTAVGQDHDEIKKTTVSIHSVTGMGQEAAICVRFHEDDEYAYAYVCADYVPNTLGDFVSMLNLKNELGTTLCYLDGYPSFTAYEDVDMPLIWNMLLVKVKHIVFKL